MNKEDKIEVTIDGKVYHINYLEYELLIEYIRKIENNKI